MAEKKTPDTPEKPTPSKEANPAAPADPWKILTGGHLDREGLQQGLANIASIAVTPKKLPSKELLPGYLGFRRGGNRGELRLVLACGKAQVRTLSLRQFVALVEKMHDPGDATVLVQNLREADNDRGNIPPRGQVLARLVRENSAFVVIQGLTGKVIRGPAEIVLHDAYYVPRDAIQAFYLAAKCQLGIETPLTEALELYDGWREFQLPIALCGEGESP